MCQKACHTFHLYLILHVTPLSLLSTANIDSVWYHPCLISALSSCILEFYIFCFLLGLLKKEFCEVFLFLFAAVYYPGRFMSITLPCSYQKMQQKIFIQLCINNCNSDSSVSILLYYLPVDYYKMEASLPPKQFSLRSVQKQEIASSTLFFSSWWFPDCFDSWTTYLISGV